MFKKLSAIISVICVAAMMLQLMPVFADVTETELKAYTDYSGSISSLSSNTSRSEFTDGIGLKEKGDSVAYYFPKTAGSATDMYMNWSWGKTSGSAQADAAWDKVSYNGYLVYEFSIYKNGTTNIYMGTDQSSEIVANVNGYIKDNQWARVQFVIKGDGDNSNGWETSAYVNGTLVIKEKTVNDNYCLGKWYAGGNRLKNVFRLCIKHSGYANVYMDDLRIYETAALPAFGTPAFPSSDMYQVSGDKFQVKGLVTAGTIVENGTQAGYTVKVYTDSSMTTEVAANVNVVPGNIVAATGKSTYATERTLTYNDIYGYFTVSDIVTNYWGGTPDASRLLGVTADSSLVLGNVCGNTETRADHLRKYIVNSGRTNAYFNRNGSAFTGNYLVYRMNILPGPTATSAYFGTVSSTPMCDMLMVGEDIVPGKWNNVVLVYDFANNLADTYVNGVLVCPDYKVTYSTCLRFILNISGGDYFYADDYSIDTYMLYPEIASAVKLADGYNSGLDAYADNASGMLTLGTAKTVADVEAAAGSDIVVYKDNTYSQTLADSDTLADGNVIVILKDNIYTYYTIENLKNNSIIPAGDTYYASVTDGGVLILAQYDNSGKLIGNVITNSLDTNGTISLTLNLTSNTKTAKVFLFDKITSAKPLCGNITIPVK